MLKAKDIIEKIEPLFPGVRIAARRNSSWSKVRLPIIKVDCVCDGKEKITSDSWKESYSLDFEIGVAAINESDEEETRALADTVLETLEQHGIPNMIDATPEDLVFGLLSSTDYQDATVWTFTVKFFTTHKQAT